MHVAVVVMLEAGRGILFLAILLSIYLFIEYILFACSQTASRILLSKLNLRENCGCLAIRSAMVIGNSNFLSF